MPGRQRKHTPSSSPRNPSPTFVIGERESRNDDSLSESRQGYTRRHARELALQILFQWDFHGLTECGPEQFRSQRQTSTHVREFAGQLVTGVQTHHGELDALITAHAKNWTIDRMPLVDRNILRQAIYELIWVPDVPAKVTVNEAIELTRCFADEETGRFVNGVLDHIIKTDPRLDLKRMALGLEQEPLSRERAKLDPNVEKTLAEEGVAADASARPKRKNVRNPSHD